MSATVVSLDPLVKPIPTVDPSKYFDVQDKVEDPLAVERVIESMFPPDLYTEKTDDYDTYIKNINKQYFKGFVQKLYHNSIDNITYQYYKESTREYLLSASIQQSNKKFCVFHRCKVYKFKNAPDTTTHLGDIAILEKGYCEGLYILKRYTRISKTVMKRKDDIMMIYISKSDLFGAPPDMYIHILPMCLQYNKKYNSKYVCSEEESFDIYDLVPNIKYNSIKNTTEKKKSSILKAVKRSTGKMIKQLTGQKDLKKYVRRVHHFENKPPYLEKKTNRWLLDFEGRKGMNDPYENIIRYYCPKAKKYIDCLRFCRTDELHFRLDIYTLYTPLQAFAVFMATQLYELEHL